MYGIIMLVKEKYEKEDYYYNSNYIISFILQYILYSKTKK